MRNSSLKPTTSRQKPIGTHALIGTLSADDQPEDTRTSQPSAVTMRSDARGLPSDLVRPRPRPSRLGSRLPQLIGGVLVMAAMLLFMRYGLPKPAELAPVGRGSFRANLSGPATLDATNKAAVSSDLQGVITALHVDRNDMVRTGDVIAEISARDLKAQLEASVASHSAAQKAVEAAAADYRRAEATLANARSTLARQQRLLRSGTSTQSVTESAQTSVEQAEADLAKAGSLARQTEAQEAAAAATVELNRAQLEKSVIRAPIGGVVIARDLNLGDLVSPGNAIVEIVDPSSVVATARFDESAITSVTTGQAARVRFTSQDDRAPFSGRVRRLGREVDTETREFTVDIAPDRLPLNWAIGQRATVEIDLDVGKDVIAIPSRAIDRRQGPAGVWVVEDERAAWRSVELGRVGGALVEVRSGLREGDLLLIDPKEAYAFMLVAGRRHQP